MLAALLTLSGTLPPLDAGASERDSRTTPPAAHVARAATGSRRPALACAACFLVDDTGRVLWSRGEDERRANASTTKMVSALVVARRADLDDTVVVSPAAAATGGGGLDLDAGERWGLEELLYALLLTSSNDAAVALAEHVAGSEDAFVVAMNRAAGRLGATRSHFVTPHGLDEPGHFATAEDLATIAERLLATRLLRAIVSTSEITVTGPDGPVELTNRNVLLEGYQGAVGVKTGFTDDAGEVLVAAAERRGRQLIAVAMASDNAARDCRRLLDLGWRKLASSVLVTAGQQVGWLVFDPGGAIPAVAGTTVRGMAGPRALDAVFAPDPGARPPLAPGETVGTVTVGSGDRTLATVPAVAGAEVSGTLPPGPLEVIGAVLRAAHEVGTAATPW
ncbi:D-alanyl-D-alanine carboxypeptidase family protein [soil metagenome]